VFGDALFGQTASDDGTTEYRRRRREDINGSPDERFLFLLTDKCQEIVLLLGLKGKLLLQKLDRQQHYR
jgi:hypothetical protein